MTAFVLVAALLAALTLAWVLRPLYARRAASGAAASRTNAAVYREQLARLDQDLTDGLLGAEEHAQMRDELQRRALEEVPITGDRLAWHAPRRTAIALAVVVPLVAASLYALLGTPAGLGDVSKPKEVTAADIERMVAQLAARMEKDPSDPKGWVMLARSYKVLGRGVESEKAYDRAGSIIDNDAQELANYADVAASNAGGRFAGKPAALIEKALRVDPQQPMALWLAGSAAMQAGDRASAVRHWQQLLALLPPDSDDAREITGLIAQAGGRPAEAPKQAAAASGAGVSGVVEIDPSLKADPNNLLLVIARVPGNRMPVAVLRAQASQLPLKFTLDDSLAMTPQSKISGAGEVEVEARVSRSGDVIAKPGDFSSDVQRVRVGSTGVVLRIATVRR